MYASPQPSPRLGRRELAWIVAGAAMVLSTQAPAQSLVRPSQLSAEEAGVQLSIDLSKPVRAGAVSVGVSGQQLSVKEAWRTREDRQVKYDVSQAYARYFCGSANVLHAQGEWKPGYSTRDGWFTYEDTVRFECIRPDAVRGGGPPGGLKWSKYGAAAWLAPYAPGQELVKAEVRFGTLRPSEATDLVQLALYHAAVGFRVANCASPRLPRAQYIETVPSQPPTQSDVVLTVRFVCD